LKKVGRNPPDVTYAAAGRLEGSRKHFKLFTFDA
jgi:hypothetical protein